MNPYDVYRVRHTLTGITRNCGACGKPVCGPWAVFLNDAPCCSSCGKKVAPHLAAVAARIKTTGPDDEQRHYVIRRSAEATTGGLMRCPETGVLFEPRPLEISYRGAGTLLSVEGGENVAKTLADALHRHYGSKPAPRPVPPPPPPPPPTAEDIAEAKHRASVAAIAAA